MEVGRNWIALLTSCGTSQLVKFQPTDYFCRPTSRGSFARGTGRSLLKTMPEEAWKPVVGFEGLYEVSDLGRVRSLPRKWCRGSIRALVAGTNGYFGVQLAFGGVKSPRQVHRLVLEAFKGPCPGGQEACHINGDRTDNRLQNLRWDTRAKNHADKRHHGTSLCGERNPASKLKTDEVAEIRQSRGLVSGRALAQKFGVCAQTISLIQRGERWHI